MVVLNRRVTRTSPPRDGCHGASFDEKVVEGGQGPRCFETSVEDAHRRLGTARGVEFGRNLSRKSDDATGALELLSSMFASIALGRYLDGTGPFPGDINLGTALDLDQSHPDGNARTGLPSPTGHVAHPAAPPVEGRMVRRNAAHRTGRLPQWPIPFDMSRDRGHLNGRREHLAGGDARWQDPRPVRRGTTDQRHLQPFEDSFAILEPDNRTVTAFRGQNHRFTAHRPRAGEAVNKFPERFSLEPLNELRPVCR